MNILFTGSIDGEILDFYSKVLSLEKEYKLSIDWIFAVGDFGIWPDPQTLDKATKMHKKTAGDFPYLYLNQWEVPRPTIIIEGVHDDHKWLNNRIKTGNLELIPNLTLLVNGNHLTLDDLNITGVGKSFSQKTYSLPQDLSHYVVSEVKNACLAPANLVITYEAPYGKTIKKFKSIAVGITNILLSCKPRLHVHSTPYRGRVLEKEGNLISLALGKRETALFKYENSYFSLIA